MILYADRGRPRSWKRPGSPPSERPGPKKHSLPNGRMAVLASGTGNEGAGELDPVVALDAPVELEVRIDLRDIGRRHGCELPIMPDAALVELLLQLRADPGQVAQVVGRSTGRRKKLECFAGGLHSGSFGGQLLGERLRGLADVDAHVAMRA